MAKNAEQSLETGKVNAATRPQFDPPVFLVTIAALVGIWNIGQTYLGAVQTGISWDERVHGLLMQEWFDSRHYWLPQHAYQPLGFIFGPVGDLIGHAFAVVFRAEAPGVIEFTAEAFAARHVAVATVGVFGIVGVGLIMRVSVNSWRWAVVAMATLTSIPLWTGHSMFDMKDIAVATGYTYLTLGLVMLSQNGQPGFLRWQLPGIGAFVAGSVLAIGTRNAMWVPVLFSCALMFVPLLMQMSASQSWSRALGMAASRMGMVAAGAFSAYLILLMLYPDAWRPPFPAATMAASESANFTLSSELTPWTYIPKWFGHQIPMLIIGFWLLGVSYGIICVLRTVFRRPGDDAERPSGVQLGLILSQVFATPLAIVVLQSRLYDGVRHLLFVLPAVAVLCTLGMQVLWHSRVTSGRRGQLGRIVVSAAIAASVIVPTLDQTRLFPYNYAYFNEIATLRPIEGNWPTDYWRTSWRELAGKLPNDDLAVCPPRVFFDNDVAAGWPQVDTYSCRFEYLVSPYLSESAAGRDASRSATNFWILRENYSGYYVPRNCEVYDSVTRPLRGQEIMMSYLLDCRFVEGTPPP